MWWHKGKQVVPTLEEIALAEVNVWRLRLIYELNLRGWPEAVELTIDTGGSPKRFPKKQAFLLAETERVDPWRPQCFYALSDDNILYDLQGSWRRESAFRAIQPPYDVWKGEITQDAAHIIAMLKVTIARVQRLPVAA